MIKAVFFDVDGVLIDSLDANYDFTCNIFSKFNYPAPTKDQYVKLFHLSMKDLLKELIKEASEERISEMYVYGSTEDGIYDQSLIKIQEGAYETMEKLQKDYKLGLVTNRIKKGLYGDPQLKKFVDYSDVVVTVEDVKNPKPHPEPLRKAMNAVGVLPEQTVYIGDAYSDFMTAQNAGTKYIQFRGDQNPGADSYVTELGDIPEVVSKL